VCACACVCARVPAILQICDVLGGYDPSLATILSIAISCVSIAILSSNMFLSKDCDEANRLDFPTFYGATREARLPRSVTTVSLVLFQTTHVISALTCISLLIKTSGEALAVYLTARMALYVAYKVARRNWAYWVPGMRSAGAILPRIVGKLFVDFTGNPQFRHAYEVGGAYWLFTCVETQLSTVGSCLAYSRFANGASKVPDATLLLVLGVLLGAWAIALVTFVLSTRRSHWRTFVSIETGSQFSESVFHGHAGNDERRMIVFRDNVAMWSSFRSQLADWLASNYSLWTGPNAPMWFTDTVRSTIPIDMLPLTDIVATFQVGD
jgi:hypothetical protein